MINLQDILKTKEPKVDNTLFIAVDGHGGSGKTTFAKLLAERLEAEQNFPPTEMRLVDGFWEDLDPSSVSYQVHVL